MLTVTVRTMGNTAILRCQGRIVCGQESTLLCAALQHQGLQIILDLEDVSAIDAAGIGALISLLAAGIYIRLMNPSRPVREVLRVAKLESVFEICEDQPVA